MRKLLLLNLVGLTPALVGEWTPNLRALAAGQGVRPLDGGFPALTLSAQATMLTGRPPSAHGVVGNGWLFRDTMEPRLWQQSRALVDGTFFYEQAQQAGARVANLFWWFNQGCTAEYALTPKPYYSCDGNKAFGVHGWPEGFAAETEAELGPFPFHAFWGPEAGAASTEWIARATIRTIRQYAPELVLAYLPHLDYDLQRFGGQGAHLRQNLQTIDRMAGMVIDAAREAEYEVVVVSEYGICDVRRPVHINRLLREAGFMTVRPGPFGEILETFQSRAFAVSDHQIAHVYIRNPADIPAVRALLLRTPGIAEVLDRAGQSALHMDHPRTGELLALAQPDAWFTWYFSLEAAREPDFARTVDIHRKPGYDPAELFYDRQRPLPKARAALALLRKKLGMRYRFDVISADAGLVRGSHGLPPQRPEDGAVLLSTLPLPDDCTMLNLGMYLLQAMHRGGAQ